MFNKKGTTLMEVIISIALISVVLVFMIKLLIDLNNTESNNEYAKGNQINRTEIIRAIEDDIRGKSIVSITDGSPSTDNLVINFTFSDGTNSSINCTKDTFSYSPSSGDTRRWTMAEGTIYTESANVYVGYRSDSPNNLYTLLIDIEVHTPNDNNSIYTYQDTENGRRVTSSNNTLDDFLISYVGTNNIPSLNCLGKDC